MNNQHSNHEEIKYRHNVGNSCYHRIQILFSPRPNSKNLKIIYIKLKIKSVAYSSQGGHTRQQEF